MNINWIYTALWALAPISELRGAIPFGHLKYDLPLLWVAIVSIGLNALIPPLVFIFLSTFNKLFLKMAWYEKLFNRFVERARVKLKSKVDRFGYFGIMMFVAIPLPITGAYTGTLGAWILGLSKRKTILAACGGVLISGTIITTLVILFQSGVEWVSFFFKH